MYSENIIPKFISVRHNLVISVLKKYMGAYGMKKNYLFIVFINFVQILVNNETCA